MRPGIVLLFAVLTACDAGVLRRSVQRDPGTLSTDSVDWTQSVGIFIGVESFRSETDAPTAVRHAADDATDLAWLFSDELPSLLRRDRTLLLLSGSPDKETSRMRLLALRREGTQVIDPLPTIRRISSAPADRPSA